MCKMCVACPATRRFTSCVESGWKCLPIRTLPEYARSGTSSASGARLSRSVRGAITSQLTLIGFSNNSLPVPQKEKNRINHRSNKSLVTQPLVRILLRIRTTRCPLNAASWLLIVESFRRECLFRGRNLLASAFARTVAVLPPISEPVGHYTMMARAFLYSYPDRPAVPYIFGNFRTALL